MFAFCVARLLWPRHLRALRCRMLRASQNASENLPLCHLRTKVSKIRDFFTQNFGIFNRQATSNFTPAQSCRNAPYHTSFSGLPSEILQCILVVPLRLVQQLYSLLLGAKHELKVERSGWILITFFPGT